MTTQVPRGKRREEVVESARSRVLWRGQGARGGCLDARLTEDGDLVIRHQDAPASAVEAWGPAAYEATLEIRREHLGELALILLKAGFAGERDALELLRLFCERRGVPHRFSVWT